MIKVYFNKYQFLEGEAKGLKNRDNELCADVKYVESTNNKIIVGESEEDKKDWEIFSSNMKEYLQYFEGVILERVEEEKKKEYEDNNSLLEENFVVIQR